MGSQKEHKLCNVEVAPGSRRFSLRCFNATTPPFFHTNDYRTLENVTQYKSPSSLQRIARAAAMPVPKTPEVRDRGVLVSGAIKRVWKRPPLPPSVVI